jgi:hypothetical protein
VDRPLQRGELALTGSRRRPQRLRVRKRCELQHAAPNAGRTIGSRVTPARPAQSIPDLIMKELHSWHEEQRSAYLYRLLAELEAGTSRSRLFSSWRAKRTSNRASGRRS